MNTDASRAKRIAMATGLQVPDGLLAEETIPEEPREDDASDVSQVGDLANDGMDCPAPDMSVPKQRVLDVDPEHCVRHILSGFVHVKSSVAGKLLCGRIWSANMIQLPLDSELTRAELCDQCARARAAFEGH